MGGTGISPLRVAANSVDPGGVSVDGEVGMNHVLKVTANNAAIDSYANHS